MASGEIMCRLIGGTQEQVQSGIEHWKKEKGKRKKEKGEDDAINIENGPVELS